MLRMYDVRHIHVRRFGAGESGAAKLFLNDFSFGFLIYIGILILFTIRLRMRPKATIEIDFCFSLLLVDCDVRCLLIQFRHN